MIVVKKIKKFICKHCSYERRAKILRTYGIVIGKNSEIQSDVNFGSEPYLIELGDNVRITSGVKFVTHDGGLWVLRNNGRLKNADKFGKITVGNNVHIGFNTIIMPGVNIGNNVIIGCGAIVTKDISIDGQNGAKTAAKAELDYKREKLSYMVHNAKPTAYS